ncbi:MAG: Crp/Fnr family transcriptional regulator [Pseudomonadota bacterium]
MSRHMFADRLESSTVPTLEAPIKCANCPIAERAVCAYCEPPELVELDQIKSYKTFEPGQEIVGAGEESVMVGSVVEGVVKLTKTLVDGRRQMVGLLFPSDFIGRAMRPTVEYDAVAATKVVLCAFPKSPFERLLKRTPHLEQRLLEMTLDELDAAREWLLLLGRKTAKEKVASFLCILAARTGEFEGADAGRKHFQIPISREDMADYLGLTIETVSRQITALRKDGVIEIDGPRRIVVSDLAELMETAGDDAEGGIIP